MPACAENSILSFFFYRKKIGGTYVEPRRVKGAFIRDAGRRVGVIRILEVALLQQALSLVNNGFHHRNRQGHGSGERDEARQQAEDQQDPLLRGRDQRFIREFNLAGLKGLYLLEQSLHPST